MKNKKTLALPCLVALILALMVCLGAAERPQWTDKQHAAHQAAEILRAADVDESSEPIQALKQLWWDEEDMKAPQLEVYEQAGITYEDYCSMCKMVQYEASDICTLEHKQCVAVVCWNRVHSDSFPDTVVEVLTQPRQYSSWYVTDNLMGISQETIDAVNSVLLGDYTLPGAVWQANFPQGSQTLKTFEVSYQGFHSWTYICA